MKGKMKLQNFRAEVKNGSRFAFGKNWKAFSPKLNKIRIEEAEASLKNMLEVESLVGKTFLDVGSGSGLFSLAARNLGASVVSFDYDEICVACTSDLKQRFRENDNDWKILNGSVLDPVFLKTLGQFDYVYSWGVLHHTGDMWNAIDNVIDLVRQKGVLFISLYNHQQFASTYWNFVKKTYNRLPISRPLWITIHLLYPTLPSVALRYMQKRKTPRGMTLWNDLLDWLGGYPFEVSNPSQIFNFYKAKGFTLIQLKTVGGKLGCNEFVFRRIANK